MTATVTGNPGRRMAAKHNPFGSADAVNLIDFTVAAKVATTIKVTLQLKDANGAPLLQRANCYAYLSNDANGDSVCTTAPTTDTVIATNGVIFPTLATAYKTFHLTSEANGLIDLNIVDSGTPLFYLVVVLPDGSLLVSPAIQF